MHQKLFLIFKLFSQKTGILEEKLFFDKDRYV